MADFAISQNVPGFVLLIRTLSFFIRLLQIQHQNKREICLFTLMYFNLHYINLFLKYIDLHKWQGTFFTSLFTRPIYKASRHTCSDNYYEDQRYYMYYALIYIFRKILGKVISTILCDIDHHNIHKAYKHFKKPYGLWKVTVEE